MTAGANGAPAAPPAPRVAALDGLRGIAILLVLVVHYYVSVPTPDGVAVHDFLRRAGSLFFGGVDLFFVLSGYLIGGILVDHRESSTLLPAFYLRRFFRIVPLYLILLASFFVARSVSGLSEINRGTYFWSTIPDWSFFGFVQNVAMAWRRDIGPYWLGPTWSLAVEEQFYLLMPLLVQRLDRRQLVRVCIGAIVLVPSLRLAALWYGQNSLAAVFLLPMRADGLLCGVLCAVIVRSAAAVSFIRRQRLALMAVVSILGLALVALSAGNFGADSVQFAPFGYSVLSLFFAGILLQVVLFPGTRWERALSFKPLALLGVTSYFTYLFHTPIWYMLHWLFFRLPPLHFHWQAGVVTGMALGVTLMLAWCSWRLLESPLLRFARRFDYG